jgi:hypothetical protein
MGIKPATFRLVAQCLITFSTCIYIYLTSNLLCYKKGTPSLHHTHTDVSVPISILVNWSSALQTFSFHTTVTIQNMVHVPLVLQILMPSFMILYFRDISLWKPQNSQLQLS